MKNWDENLTFKAKLKAKTIYVPGNMQSNNNKKNWPSDLLVEKKILKKCDTIKYKYYNQNKEDNKETQRNISNNKC